jgi:hypothetical protein
MGFLNFRPWITVGCGLAVGMIACKPKTTVLKSPPGYNFQAVSTYKLDYKIREISGLAWETINDEFVTHNDESGKIFFLDRESKAIKSEHKFAGKGDYEDIAVVKGVPYVLRSDGVITRVTRDNSDTAKGEELGTPVIEGTVDFETMYYDSSRNALVIICKNCKVDDKGTVSAFAYYLDSTGFDTKPLYTIDATKIEALAPKKTSKFQPSAAGIHPLTKQLYIISSAANLMAICDLNGKVESVFWLSPKLFPQPEGLTFKGNGDMFISNEAVTGKSTILRFLFKK